jgi:hypothetical protein
VDRRQQKIDALLARLDALDTKPFRPEEAPIVAVARQAITDELSRLAREDRQANYRRDERRDQRGPSRAVDGPAA